MYIFTLLKWWCTAVSKFNDLHSYFFLCTIYSSSTFLSQRTPQQSISLKPVAKTVNSQKHGSSVSRLLFDFEQLLFAERGGCSDAVMEPSSFLSCSWQVATGRRRWTARILLLHSAVSNGWNKLGQPISRQGCSRLKLWVRVWFLFHKRQKFSSVQMDERG